MTCEGSSDADHRDDSRVATHGEAEHVPAQTRDAAEQRQQRQHTERLRRPEGVCNTEHIKQGKIQHDIFVVEK